MSNIPAPGSGYSDYGYGYNSLRANLTSDPYGSYGATESYQTSDLQAYEQQLQTYYQNLLSVYNQLQAGDPRRAQCEQYMQMAQQYAQQVGMQLQGSAAGGFDPTAATPGNQFSFPVSYVDENHIVTDEGTSTQIMVRSSDGITKQIDVYQKDNTLAIPSSAASVSVVETGQGTDDVKAEVTITFPNGTTRKIIYHHIDREGFQLNIQSPDTSQVHMDASITGDAANASKIVAAELGSDSGTTTQAGDPPTRTDHGTRVYDGTDFNISPAASGSNHKTKVLASGECTIYPNSNEEYYVMDYSAGPPARYLITVYANEDDKAHNKIKDTISIDASLVDHVNFGGDLSRISYGSHLAVSEHPDQLDTSAAGAGKIVIGTNGSGVGTPVNSNFPEDTPPDNIDGTNKTATYDNSHDYYDNGTDVNVHVDYTNDNVDTYDITAPGQVTIHGAGFGDKYEIESYSAGPPKEWVINCYKNGDINKKKTIKIHGSSSTTVNLDAMGPDSLVQKFTTGIPPHMESALIPESDQTKIGSVNIGSSTTTNTTTASLIDTLHTATGKTPQEITQTILSSYPNIDTNHDGVLTDEELSNAQAAGNFPPIIPDPHFFQFLYNLDPQLHSLLDQFKTGNDSQRDVLIGPLRNRFSDMLQKFGYSTSLDSTTDPQSAEIDNITINGTKYDFINSGVNSDGGNWDTAFNGNPWDLISLTLAS